jgi:ABC-type cobalamin/Fe3+-siderophores transport system ATPase subunit
VGSNHCNVVTLDDPVAALGPENLIEIIHIKKKLNCKFTRLSDTFLEVKNLYLSS